MYEAPLALRLHTSALDFLLYLVFLSLLIFGD